MSEPHTLLVAISLALVMAEPLAAAPGSFDQRKARYERLVTQMRSYREHLREARWRTVHTETFEQGDPGRWRTPTGNGIAVVDTPGGKALRVDSRGPSPRPVTFEGVEVAGPYALEIELRGRSTYYSYATRQWPKSLTEAGRPPAMYIDVMAFACTRPAPAADGPITRAVYEQQLKQPRTFRMEVRRGVVTHRMDGQPIHTEPVSDKFDTTQPHHPQLAVNHGGVYIRRVAVQRLRDGADPQAIEAEAWSKAFGDTPRARAEALAAELVADLDHNDYRVRNRAHVFLSKLTDLAHDQLRRAAKHGTAQQQRRANAILYGATRANPLDMVIPGGDFDGSIRWPTPD